MHERTPRPRVTGAIAGAMRGGFDARGDPTTAQRHRLYDVATSDLGRRAAARPWDGLRVRDRRVARKGTAAFPPRPIRSDNCGGGVGRRSSRALASGAGRRATEQRRAAPARGRGMQGLRGHLGVMGDLDALRRARQPVGIFRCHRDGICRMARRGPADRGGSLPRPVPRAVAGLHGRCEGRGGCQRRESSGPLTARREFIEVVGGGAALATLGYLGARAARAGAPSLSESAGIGTQLHQSAPAPER